MSVVALWMMASAVIGLGERSPLITGPDPAAYARAVWDKEVEQDAKLSGQRCESAVITSLSVVQSKWTVLVPKPGGTTSFNDGSFFKPRISTVAEMEPHEMHGAEEHLRVEACGHVRIANLLMSREWDPTTRQETGRWQSMGLLDGETIAEPRLMMDAAPVAARSLVAQALIAQPKDCPTQKAVQTFRMGETVVLKHPVDRAWTELWPATVCGKPYAVKVAFTPRSDGPGTRFEVSPVSPDTTPDSSPKP